MSTITVAKVAGVFQKHPEVDALKDVLEELVNQGERFLETDRDSIVSAYSEACITAASNPRLKKADAKTYLKQSANAQLQWESIPVQEILRNLRLQEERERVRADTRTHVADNFIEVNQDFILRNTKRPHEDNVVNIPTAQRHRNALVYEYRKTNRSNRLPYHNILVKARIPVKDGPTRATKAGDTDEPGLCYWSERGLCARRLTAGIYLS
ncbi:hypothetical protein BDZ88DRAFT_52539 [Geranomyces variabilis]|nr:hypothetical protein BDZ88DRAFT_52539 [Geranomyces variabilis]